jgi:hypothetical protein
MTLPNYPLPSREALLSQFRGQPLTALPTPAVVLDRALVAKHCAAMLHVCNALNVGFRAHVKSHKTLEVAQMQVGGKDDGQPADFIVSTLVEAEALAGWLAECQAKGREGSVSLPPSCFWAVVDVCADSLRRAGSSIGYPTAAGAGGQACAGLSECAG